MRSTGLKIWTVNLDCSSGDLSLLSTSERVRADRLKRPQDRDRSLRAHCALRHILALQLGCDPRHIEFDTTAAGKPMLARPAQGLQFNLSHSGRHGLIAAAKDRCVGVDIEVRRPITDPLGVTLQIATPREARLLKQLPTSQVLSSFFDLWTRKEAVLKALGRGLFIDPREVEVGPEPGRSIVKFDERTWTVESLAISSGVAAAAAIEGELDIPLVVSSHESKCSGVDARLSSSP
ncbi:4'-phosphopantetheinyl transferase superfamily protein [Bradyrhizobium sp. sGM-13]|uniref:4'-phosphopantetheinyl transferase family protein n=1 Tax=Bradyrhizobium sp. sGM-13 TaxID=2831781 RepID=UPI001BCE7935|nr:4'-phosphopantetheinyl transferase superfamily protein [Bradyrhizobium sp. sGM-13]